MAQAFSFPAIKVDATPPTISCSIASIDSTYYSAGTTSATVTTGTATEAWATVTFNTPVTSDVTSGVAGWVLESVAVADSACSGSVSGDARDWAERTADLTGSVKRTKCGAYTISRAYNFTFMATDNAGNTKTALCGVTVR